MSIQPELVTDHVPQDVAEFLRTHPYAMLYHQPEWLEIVSALTSSRLRYVVGRDSRTGRIKAAVPLCLKDGPCGVVANSSPFFGSHGGILAADRDGFFRLAEALKEFLKEEKAVAANLIEPLLESEPALYAESFTGSEIDRRIGQFKDLRNICGREALFDSLAGLTRSNLTRKAWRSGMRIFRDESPAALDMLCAMHAEEMRSKPGGNPKPKRFFDLIGRGLTRGNCSYRVYWGERDGDRVAGLLLLLWREWVEYITPVFKDYARGHQPLSGLIFEAMLDAANEGYHWWNFGGTWMSQGNLKTFKDSWGVKNKTYHYYILDLGGLDALKRGDRGSLKDDYYGFYLYPF
jgi:hypothetical protein